MVVVSRMFQVPFAGKATAVLLVANEARGSLMALGIFRDYRVHGLSLSDLWLLPLLIAPPLALWAWRWAQARRRIDRRLYR